MRIDTTPPPVATLTPPGPIEVVEGTSNTLSLDFLNLGNAGISYQYSFSTAGGTASSADFDGSAGLGFKTNTSTSPISPSVDIPYTAYADNLVEGTETVFLDVSLNGISFSDGHARQRFEISIIDNARPTGLATVSGETIEDALLTADISRISDADGMGAGSFQWRKDGVAISGETGTSYRLGDSDVGSSFSFVYAYTDGAGIEESVTSATTDAIQNLNDAAKGTLGVSGGPALVGRELTAQTNAIADEDGLGSFDFQWLRNDEPITGAAGQTYTPDQQDVGKELSLRVSFTDGHGTLESLVSAGALVTSAAATADMDLRIGNAGNNVLDGGAGADTLIGNSGDDVLIGDAIDDAVDTTGAQVYRVYQAALGRAPDSTGFTNWTARLDGGQTVQEIIPGFVNSAEFRTTYGALDNESFVTLLYNNVLDRAPDSGGLANWSARLDDGASRASVVAGFSESTEFREQTHAQASTYVAAQTDFTDVIDDVFRLYQAALDRVPDLTGLENWAERLSVSTDYGSVANGFVGSTEFQNNYGALDNSGFVTQLYQNVLERAPDANGLANWTARLDDGMSRAAVVRGFAQAQEFMANTDDAFLTFMRNAEGDTLDSGAGDDLLLGSFRADIFVFNADDEGNNRVFQLDPWDTIELNGFGYESAADALEHFAEVNVDTVFRDGDVSVAFANTTLETFDDVTFLI